MSETLTKLSDFINTTRKGEYKASSGYHAQDILQLLWHRILYLKEKVEQATTDYNLHPIHARSKKGFLDIVGSASKYLFGTATEDDIRDLREHYNHVLSYAAHNRRVINLNDKKIAKLEFHLTELLDHTNKLTSMLNKALQRLDQITEFLLVDQTLHVIETIISSVSEVKEEIITDMIDAAHGRVIPSLFPLPDLIDTINKNCSFQPLYPPDMSQYYFPLLEASLTTEAIIVHIPFQSREVFEAFKVIPFPFSAENSVLTVDMPSSLALVAKDYTFYSTSSFSDLQFCKSSFPHKYHCSASQFAFLSISGGVSH